MSGCIATKAMCTQFVPKFSNLLARVVTSKPDQYSSTLKAPRLLVLKTWLMAVSLRLSTFPHTLLQK